MSMKIKHTILITLISFIINIPAVYSQNADNELTANMVIELIKENVTCEWADETVDTFKEGNPDTKVTGIATTFMATLDVLKKAKAMGCNLIITHEPTYYNHLDETDHFGDDKVIAMKRKFIQDNNMVVFRFHDHIHRTNPDGIYVGMIKQLGWERYRVKTDNGYIFKLNRTTVGDLTANLTGFFKGSPVRLVGNPNMEFTNVALCVGSPGYMAHVRMLERDDVDVVVAGEVPEWESIPYVRDAAAAGMKKAMVLIGHVNSEEGGMMYCAEWMENFIKEVPIHFIEAGDPFWTP